MKRRPLLMQRLAGPAARAVQWGRSQGKRADGGAALRHARLSPVGRKALALGVGGAELA
jgi:hypothetical protein